MEQALSLSRNIRLSRQTRLCTMHLCKALQIACLYSWFHRLNQSPRRCVPVGRMTEFGNFSVDQTGCGGIPNVGSREIRATGSNVPRGCVKTKADLAVK